MSTAFSSSDIDTVNRKILFNSSPIQDLSYVVEDIYEVPRCVKWIKANNFHKVALQFPDILLRDAATVAIELERQTNKQMFILGDTSYESCCIDEIAAEHVLADAIIHYGHSCLSTTKRLPVLYIFGKHPVDVLNAEKEFEKLFPDKNSPVIVLYEVIYSHSICDLTDKLSDYKNLIVSQLNIPVPEKNENSSQQSNQDSFNTNLYSSITNQEPSKISRCGRKLLLPRSHSLDSYSIFYVGSENQILANLMLSFNRNKFFTYNPHQKSSCQESLNVNQYLMKRYFYIEKAKDAKIIGILVGTLGVADYLAIIKHLRDIIKAAGKKSYTLVVGKLNAVKLANFPEIEVFVHVACSESSLIDCRGYYQPIITPYELEVACNQAREWAGDYITDFGYLLPGAADYLSPSNLTKWEGDVSLITGKIRSTHLNTQPNVEDSNSAIVARNQMDISKIHSQAAGEYLTSRVWQGLEQRLGETPAAEITPGRTGIASQYDGEKELCNDNKN